MGISTMGSMTESPPRGALTRAAVVALARELVVSDGIDAVSLREIGRRLGVTAPALYTYVDDREDLLRAVASEGLALLASRFDDIQQSDPLDRLREQCRRYVEFAIENPGLFAAMFAYPPELAGAAPLGIESADATSLFTKAAATIEAAAAAGEIDAPDDPTLTALTVWSIMHGAATVLTLGFAFDGATREGIIERSIDGALAVLGARERGES